MVFLFPGIIFRKFFFQGKFKNQFEHGNTLERILWNMLTSVFCIFTFAALLYILKAHFDFSFFKELEYKDIYGLFNDLSTNTFPEKLEKFEGLKLFVTVFTYLYVYSALIGYLTYLIVTKFKLDKRFFFFRFNNHWEYLVNVNSRNFKNLKLLKSYATYVDVLIGNQESKSLYRGRLHDIIYNKENKIEYIALKDTLEFKEVYDYKCYTEDEKNFTLDGMTLDINSLHLKRDNKVVYKKVIDGHVFVIPYDGIKNINFTYVEISDRINTRKLNNVILFTSTLLGPIAIIFLFLNLFFNLLFPNYIDSTLKLVVFTLDAILVLVLLIDLNFTNFKEENLHKNSFYSIYLILMVASPLLWIFRILPLWAMVLLLVLSLFFHNIKNISMKAKLFFYLLFVAFFHFIFFLIKN